MQKRSRSGTERTRNRIEIRREHQAGLCRNNAASNLDRIKKESRQEPKNKPSADLNEHQMDNIQERSVVENDWRNEGHNDEGAQPGQSEANNRRNALRSGHRKHDEVGAEPHENEKP